MSESSRNPSHLPSASLPEARQSISDTSELAKVNRRARQAAPSADDIVRETGARVDYKPDGSWVAHVPKDKIKRGVEMMEGPRRIKLERDRERGARREEREEKVVTRDGRVVGISPELVDQLKDKRGLRPVGRGGVSGRLFFGMSSASSKYVRGPDGLDFIWNDGWEPASLFTPNAGGRQRDPDGVGVWVKVDGDWELEA
jgi:hypothetical protein